MATLLNIRLSKEDAARVAKLRRKGIIVSDLVRSALREECDRQLDTPPASPADLLEWLHNKYPAPTTRKSRRVDTTDRKQVAAFMRSRLKKRSAARKLP
jgi:hypothetical protein